MITVTFHMKSGAAINVDCDSMEITREGNKLSGYSLENVSPQGSAYYIRLDDVSAITYKEKE